MLMSIQFVLSIIMPYLDIFLRGKREVPYCSKFKSPETRQVQDRLVSTLEHMQVPKWDRTRCPEESASPFGMPQDKSSDVATLRQLQNSNALPKMSGVVQTIRNKPREHQIIFTKYKADHPTAVTENNSSAGMLIISIKVLKLFIDTNNFT